MTATASAASPGKKLLASCRRGVARFGGGGSALILALAGVLAWTGWYMSFGQNPWDCGIPEKLGQGEPLTIGDTMIAGLWLGAVVNFALSVCLLLTCRWWARPLEADRERKAFPPAPGNARVFWIVVAGAVIAAAWIRAPRLSQSFWNDEEMAFRKFTFGGCHVSDDLTAIEFFPTGWDRAVLYSTNGNNHVVHTVGARISHRIWRLFHPGDPETFSESAIRAGPLAFGLLTIVALAFWIRSAGFPLAGAAAAWLLALHPWHLRYSVEARGYSALLFFVTLAFLLLAPALRTGRWRWWLAYGAAQCLYLLCFAGAVYLAVGINAIVMALLLYRRDRSGFPRWAMACALGAMAFLQVMTAAVLRLWHWLEAPHMEPFPIDVPWLLDAWALLAIGAPWNTVAPGRHHFTSLLELAGQTPGFGVAVNVILPILLAVGVMAAVWKSPQMRLFFGALAIALALIWIHNYVDQVVFFSWYGIYVMLGFVAALAFVPEWFSRFHGSIPRRAVPAVCAVALVAGYGWLTHEPRSRVRAFDRHPMHAAVETVRGEAPARGPEHGNRITVAVGSGASQLRSYDPRVQSVKSLAEFEKFIALARESGRPLAVYCCSPNRVRADDPEIFARLEDPALFEKGEYLKGLEEFWSFQIYRLK